MTRGTWQGSGTFQTGGGGTETMAYCLVAAVLVIAGASWVLRHMLWIAVPAGTVLAIAAGGLIWWLRGAAKRKARYDAAFARHRAVRTVTATAAPQVSGGTQPVIENHVHYHFGNEEVAARILRKALPPQVPAREELAP